MTYTQVRTTVASLLHHPQNFIPWFETDWLLQLKSATNSMRRRRWHLPNALRVEGRPIHGRLRPPAHHITFQPSSSAAIDTFDHRPRPPAQGTRTRSLLDARLFLPAVQLRNCSSNVAKKGRKFGIDPKDDLAIAWLGLQVNAALPERVVSGYQIQQRILWRVRLRCH